MHTVELNLFLAGHGGRPRGLMDTRVKAGRVVTVVRRSNTRLHRPAEAFLANVGGSTRLAAKFLCGESSPNVLPAEVLVTPFRPCERCEEVAQHGTAWRVYAYMDDEGVVLYVGMTGNLTAREGAHARTSHWFPEASSRAVLSTHTTKPAALAAEAAAIRLHSPIYNLVHNSKGSAA